jgi:hypothetical protein
MGGRQIGRRQAGGGVVGEQLGEQRRHARGGSGDRSTVLGARGRRVRSALADLSSGVIGHSTAPVCGSTRSTRVRSQRA